MPPDSCIVDNKYSRQSPYLPLQKERENASFFAVLIGYKTERVAGFKVVGTKQKKPSWWAGQDVMDGLYLVIISGPISVVGNQVDTQGT